MRPNLIAVAAAFPVFAMAMTVCADGIHDPDANYFCIDDSPFASIGFAPGTFFLEDFEDGRLNTPGVSHPGTGLVLLRNDINSDSVDCDDGVIDGNGNTNGATTGAMYSAGVTSLQFDFDAAPFGGHLPTHVGVVITDALTDTEVTLTAYRNDVSLGSVTGFQISEQQHFTAQDRFYGFVDETGIDRIVIAAASDNDWAMDHLQYGATVCPADLDESGAVDAADLAALLAAWGPCPEPCAADLSGDGVVDPADLAVLLASWGPCPTD